MTEEIFSVFLKNAQAKLGVKSQEDMASKLGLPFRTYQNYLAGSQDGKKASARTQGVRIKIGELLSEKEMGISFPQKGTDLAIRLSKAESQIKKMNTLIDDLYEKLDAVQKQLPISQK